MALCDFAIVEMLLAARADPNATLTFPHHGCDSVITAIANDRADNLRKWLARFPDWKIDQILPVMGGGMTPLAFTCMLAGDKDCAAVLLERRADPNRRTNIGSFPLSLLCSQANAIPDLIELLVHCRADVNQRMMVTNRVKRSAFAAIRMAYRTGARGHLFDRLAIGPGSTALSTAAFNGKLLQVETLLMLRADAGIRNLQQRTAFECASSNCGRQSTSLMLDLLNSDEPSVWADHRPEHHTSEAPPMSARASLVGIDAEELVRSPADLDNVIPVEI